MKIEVITIWYNESFLAPFFLEHYSYADVITVLYDEDTTDETLNILRQYPNVRIKPIRFLDGYDNDVKIELLNNQYRQSKCDWAILADSDEFVFIKEQDHLIPDIRDYLKKTEKFQIHLVPLYQVYRHISETDLDSSLPAVGQRRHGDPNISTGVNRRYYKPILAKCGLDITWKTGCHSLVSPVRYACSRLYEKYAQSGNPVKRLVAKFHYWRTGCVLMGAHWALADPAFAVERRIKNRKTRLSANNIRKNYSTHTMAATEESILETCELHKNAPRLF